MVCTGNTCRSPMAAALLGARLAEAGVPARVHSAGLLFDGRPATPHGVAVMAARGLDTSGHRSRMLRSELAAGADLVIGLAREHVREALALRPDLWPRAFTLKELVRRGEAAVAPDGAPDVDGWLASLHAGRRPSDLLGEAAGDDVADPIGGPLSAYERTAGELDDLTARLARLLTSAVRTR